MRFSPSMIRNAPGLSTSGGPTVATCMKSRTWRKARLQLLWVEPGVQPVRVVPALEHVRRQVEADRVVDHRAPADAHALHDTEVEVRREVERAVRVELRELLGLVLREVGGRDVRAALEHQHLAAPVGELVGERRAGRAGPDDDDVGRQLLPRDVARGHAPHARPLRVDLLHRLGVARAARERDVAGPLRRVLVARSSPCSRTAAPRGSSSAAPCAATRGSPGPRRRR